jgi:hypothetical protein
MILVQIGYESVNWVEMSGYRVKWLAFINTVVNIWSPLNQGIS